MYLHISTVSGIVDRLESHGLVVRERQKSDRRVVSLRLTPKGRKTLSRSPDPPRSKVARSLENLSKSQLTNMKTSIHLLAKMMGADAIAVDFELSPLRHTSVKRAGLISSGNRT